MRRLEFLVTEVRNSTDNKDTNGISTQEIVSYFNYAQNSIATLIFKSNPYADCFKAQKEYDAVSTGIYDLPDDCFAINAISLVEGRYSVTENNHGYSKIKPISESEFSYMFGYIVRNNQILISGQNNVAQLTSLRITYFKKLKTVDVRQAKVSTVNSGVSLVLDQTPTALYAMDDHCSTVDYTGAQAVANIYFSNTSGNTLTTTDTAGVTTSQWIVAGANSCNTPELPDACEPYLLDYVRQRIYTRNNYEDAGKQNYFTENQQAELISLFSKNKKDEDNIPITDLGFLNF